MYPVQGETAEKDNSTDHVAKKVLQCPPKCVVCCAISDPKGKGVCASRRKGRGNHPVLRFSIK